ncbi:MAG TPA: glycosyltransferase [Aequorivita sp.]|nr:glycosyltransferase [Aequorivita sp.]
MYKKLKLRFRNFILQKQLLKEGKHLDFLDFDATKRGVLIVDTVIPEFDRDSGSRRLYYIIEILLKRNFNVFLMADTKEYRYNNTYCQTYRNLGVVVYEPVLDKNNRLVDKKGFVETIGPHIDYAWLHRPDNFYNYWALVKKHSKAKLIFDMVDFHYLRLKREWEQNKNPKLEAEMKKYLEMELQNAEIADVVVPITEEDQRALSPLLRKETKMVVVGNIHQFDHENIGYKNFEQRQDVLFIGSFLHSPNMDAVRYLHDKLLPLLLEKIPSIRIKIIGSYPTPEILKMDKENFKILGYVEDISEHFNSARIFVAPLAFGAGIKGKIGQSLEFGLPLVTTDIGAEGFDFSPYTKNMLAPIDDPKIFADRIVSLYTDQNLWKEVSENSKKVLDPFSFARIEERIMQALE